MTIPAEVPIVAAVIALSVAMVSFKSATLAFGHRLDAACMPRLDQFVLHHVHGNDLSLQNIRMKSMTVLTILKTTTLFIVLAAIASLNSTALALMILAAVAIVAALAYLFPRPSVLLNWPHIQPITNSDNYAELILVAALLIGFLFVLPKDASIIGGTILILLVARFSSQLKVLAKSIRNLTHWRRWIIWYWQQVEIRKAGRDMPG